MKKSFDKPIATNNATRLGNGTSLHAEGDGRGLWARRFREIVAAHTSDLGLPPAAMSEAQRSLIRRVSVLEIELEKLEGILAREEGEIDLDQYGRASGQLRRLLETLGIERVARDTTPSISDLVAGRVK